MTNHSDSLAKALERAEVSDTVVVPRKPTVDMLVAGRKQTFADMTGAHCGPSAENTYRAMLAAAPQPKEGR